MRPPDARLRPSARAIRAKGQRCVGGASVAFMAREAGIRLARITRHGGMECGRGNGSRQEQKSTIWCERPERSNVSLAEGDDGDLSGALARERGCFSLPSLLPEPFSRRHLHWPLILNQQFGPIQTLP